ncbi:MAG: metal ABC transporter substrate-binding protein [bacterium]|nr:metal ABC transporter substrate-binding protein [bacterium]
MKDFILILAAGLLGLSPISSAKLKVVTSTSDLAYFADRIGGEFVEVQSIASPRSDLHHVEVRPSYMVKLAKADVVFKVGLELDLWMDKLIDGSRNSDLLVVDCSRYIEAMEVPTGKIDASYGDLHRFGNPHYWTGPQNVEPITRIILESLVQLDPLREKEYTLNRHSLLNEIDEGLARLQPKLEQLNGADVTFYHNSWPYFAEFTSINAIGFVEPYPGVPPSPSHVRKMIKLINEKMALIVAMEPYFDRRIPDKIARETGAHVVTLYPSIGGANRDESYLEWIEGNIDRLLKALP